MRNEKQGLHKTKQRKKTQQRTIESGFCNVNNETVQIECSAHFGGKKQHKKKQKKLMYTRKPPAKWNQ